MSKYNIILVDSKDWPTPSFDSRGKPDLLAWDDAVEDWEPEETFVASAQNKEDAEKIFSLLREKYDSDEESTELEIQECKEEEMSLSDWWEWNQDRFCNPDDYNLTENDDEGEPYNWEDGELLKKQVPSYHDFITLLAVDAVRDVFDSNNCLEMSMSGKRLRNQKRMDSLWSLHDKLYKEDLEYHMAFQGGIDTSEVWADLKINVHNAERKKA